MAEACGVRNWKIIEKNKRFYIALINPNVKLDWSKQSERCSAFVDIS